MTVIMESLRCKPKPACTPLCIHLSPQHQELGSKPVASQGNPQAMQERRREKQREGGRGSMAEIQQLDPFRGVLAQQ